MRINDKMKVKKKKKSAQKPEVENRVKRENRDRTHKDVRDAYRGAQHKPSIQSRPSGISYRGGSNVRLRAAPLTPEPQPPRHPLFHP